MTKCFKFPSSFDFPRVPIMSKYIEFSHENVLILKEKSIKFSPKKRIDFLNNSDLVRMHRLNRYQNSRKSNYMQLVP